MQLFLLLPLLCAGTNVAAKKATLPKRSSIVGPRVPRGGGGLGGLGGLWEGYNNMLDEKPIQAKALTSLTGFVLGDLLEMSGHGMGKSRN